MELKQQHTICIHHRHANHEGVVDSITDTVTPEDLESGLKRANQLLANSQCRNWGCRIELDGQVIVYTLVRDKSSLPGPVRFCKLDALELAKERNATLSFETTWKVNRDLQPVARPNTRSRGARQH
ncbi:MAG: hypothetical protein ACRD1Y_08460 [Terriglobales bacterium]